MLAHWYGVRYTGCMTSAITFDRQTATWGFLILADGATYDVYSDTAADLRSEAEALATILNVTIETFNMDMPEQ